MSSQLTALDDCATCKKPVPRSEYMRCAACKAVFDLECINLSATRFYSFFKHDKKRRDAWKCLACRKIKNGDQTTPVHPVLSPEQSESSNVTLRVKSSSKTCADTSVELNTTEDMIPLDPATEMKKFCEEMRAVRTEMSMFRTAISDLKFTIESLNLRINALESRVKDLEDNRGKSDDCAVSNLEETVEQLKLEINDRDQDLLGNDVEIANYPETTNENSTHVLLTVAKKLGVQIDERDVVSAQRVGATRGAPAGVGAAPARPRPLAVRLARRSQRDALLQAARVRRRLSADDANLPAGTPSRPFYINERLTRRNRQLFQQARATASRAGWKYLWTREGRIFARQESGKARHTLRSEVDLIKVFGAEAVSND